MSKCIEIVPVGVIQKMETPVIYFHGTPKDEAGNAVATVRVDFPNGIISQRFPEATAWEPPMGALNGVETLGGGSMTWTVAFNPEGFVHTPGLRVLYVLPRSWTDELLPLTLSFTPTRTVRTLVGRIEVTTHDELDEVEGAFLTAIAAGTHSWETLGMKEVVALGRHAEAKLRAAPRAHGRCRGAELSPRGDPSARTAAVIAS